MFNRSKLFFLIPAIILIPILLTMTPLNFIQKIGGGCPLAKDKQILKCNPCPFHSLLSQDDLTIVSLDSIPLKQEPPTSLDSQVLGTDSLRFNISFDSITLRC
jgi:hypothetical protein